MEDINSEKYRDFSQTVINNIKKNGFPDKKVSLPLEKLYESASSKGLNLNKVLEILERIKIYNVKTPEKIIFYPKDKMPTQKEPAFDASAIFNVLNLKPDDYKNMDMSEIIEKSQERLKNSSPQQLSAMMNIFNSLSDEQKEALLEKAKDLGLK
ncbi:MAG: hypothetical protein JXR91_03595 [Deltaproteobacteria bacterium]|nr:hypothetical protein [Deltaproteobacteria bacterium]